MRGTSALGSYRMRTTRGHVRRRGPSFQHRDDVVRFLLSSITPVAVCAAIMLALAGYYVHVTTPKFTARTQLLLDTQPPQLLRERANQRLSQVDIAQVESQVLVLRSERIARIVIAKLGLLQDPEFSPLLANALASAEIPDAQASRIHAAIDTYLANVDAQRLGVSYVVEIAATATTPQLAEKLSNVTAEAYIEDQLKVRAQTARLSSEWLEQRIGELRKQMNRAALDVQEFKARRDYRIPSEVDAPESGSAVAVSPSTLEELEATALAHRNVYETYFRAHMDAVERQSYPGTSARFISHTVASKSHPKAARLLVLAIVGGALIGIAVAAVREELVRGHLKV